MEKLTLHHLVAEEINDKHGPGIMLTQQDDYSDPCVVVVHPWQLRAVCEQFGIVANDSQAGKTIATLQRRMLGLRDRIKVLAELMTGHADHEKAQLLALRDLAIEWCADWGEGEHKPVPPVQGEVSA